MPQVAPHSQRSVVSTILDMLTGSVLFVHYHQQHRESSTKSSTILRELVLHRMQPSYNINVTRSLMVYFVL